MSDPQDLLYTNNFVETNTLSKQQIEQDTQNYDRYINYLDNNPDSQTQEYLNTNLFESDLVNIQQTNNKPWPIDLKKNRYPLMDNLSKDISVNRYTQEQVLNLSVFSEERDKTLFQFTTEFHVELPLPLNNVKSIEITDIVIPNFNDNITNMNNNFSWQFFSDYFTNNINSFNIIPYCNPTKKISYYSLPYSTYLIDIDQYGINYNPELYLTYEINMPNGHYEINSLLQEMTILTKNVLHGGFDINAISLIVKKNQGRIPDLTLPPLMEEPYNSFPYLQNTPNLWHFEIDMNNDTFYAVNRMEEVAIVSYQTFPQALYSLDFVEQDIFYSYSSDPGNLDSKYIYITVPYLESVTTFWSKNEFTANNPFFPSAFPLVISGLVANDGQLDSFMRNLNLTPFYSLDIYLQNGYTEDELFNICYYKLNDIINIPTESGYGTSYITLFRFALRYTSAGFRGKKFNNTYCNIVPKFAYNKPTQTSTIIYSSIINNLLFNQTNKIYYFVELFPIIGRSLLCRFMFDYNNGIFTNYESDGNYEKKRSFLNLLGYSVGNQTSAFLVSSYNDGFAFVHCNKFPQILDINIPALYFNIIPPSNNFISTQTSIQTCLENGLYYLSYAPFIYVQILFISNSSNSIIQQFNIQTSQDEYSLSINTNYSNSTLTATLPLGLPVNCVEEYLDIKQKNKNNIVAKILTSTIPGNYNTVNNNINNKTSVQSFNQILDDIKTIQINILDSNYRIIQSNKNYSMVIKFLYDVHKLKETNINTKTNNVDIIGNIK